MTPIIQPVHSLSYFNTTFLIILYALVSGPFQSKVQAQDHPTVIFNIDSTRQLIRGFGAANIVGWRPDLNDADLDRAFNVQTEGMGLSILRLRVAPQEDHWNNQSAWMANLPTAQKAHERGITLIASPWTPPSSMKSNNDLVGGTLREDAYADYAEYLNHFAEFMAENGAPIYAISVQNEPDIAVGYESCDYSPEQMLNFVKHHGHLITATKLMAPESFQFRRVMSDPILHDSLATVNTDIISGHVYGGGNSSYPLAEEKGKEIWMTEYLMNLNTGNISTPWEDFSRAEKWEETLDMALSVNKSMKNNWNAYIWWYLKRYYSFLGDGTQRTADSSILKRGYAFSQFSRFVRPGYHRINVIEPTGRGLLRLETTAYVHPDSSKLIIVAINDESNDLNLDFAFPSYNSSHVTAYRTSISEDVEEVEDFRYVNGYLNVDLPKGTITTYIVDFALKTTIEEDPMDLLPKAPQLLPNYPNPFNPNTTISFRLSRSEAIQLKVYSMLGQEIQTLADGFYAEGLHHKEFDARHLSSGWYLVRLQSESGVSTQSILLQK